MDVRADGSFHLLRLDPGEKIMESLLGYLEANEGKIASGFLMAIGATSCCEIGWYDLTDQEYKTTIVEENCEITSLIGNIAWMDRKPIVHAHITLGKRDYSIVGGHLVEGTISATCEIWIQTTPIRVARKPALFQGLKLINFESR